LSFQPCRKTFRRRLSEGTHGRPAPIPVPDPLRDQSLGRSNRPLRLTQLSVGRAPVWDRRPRRSIVPAAPSGPSPPGPFPSIGSSDGEIKPRHPPTPPDMRFFRIRRLNSAVNRRQDPWGPENHSGLAAGSITPGAEPSRAPCAKRPPRNSLLAEIGPSTRCHGVVHFCRNFPQIKHLPLTAVQKTSQAPIFSQNEKRHIHSRTQRI